ncbi:MAG: hypothetical protein AYW82_01255 [Bifidobacterium dentium]|nr:MAG: hypothetical protein AYW82_01255 [Bifidobacterium dentium]
MREGFELCGCEVDDGGFAAIEDMDVKTAKAAGPEVNQRMLLRDEVDIARVGQPVPCRRGGRVI